MISLQQKGYFQQLIKRSNSCDNYLGKLLSQKIQNYYKKINQGQFNIRAMKMSLNFNEKPYSFDKNNNKQMILQQAMPYEHKQVKIITDNERLNFVKQMRRGQQRLSKQKEQKHRSALFKQMQVQLREKQIKKQQQQLKKQNKRRQIQQRLRQIQENKEIREQTLKQRQRQLQQKIKQVPLADKMKQSFLNLQNESLVQKKRKLIKIRQMHKSISKQQLDQHLQRIKQFKDMKKQEKQQELISENNFKKHFSYQFYKSKWYKNVMTQQKNIELIKQMQEKQRLKQLKDRQKKYSLYIKSNFMPQSDEKLIEDIVKRIQSPIKRKKAKQIRQMGIDNLKYVKQIILTRQQMEAKKQESQSQSAQTKANRQINYLQDIKNRRSHSLNENFLQKIHKKGLSQSQKTLKVKNFAQQLQKKANLRQQLNRVKNPKLVDEQLDDIYAKALQAKLKLLNVN